MGRTSDFLPTQCPVCMVDDDMTFNITWPNGSRTKKKITSMRQLDRFVAAQFALGLDVELKPTEVGPLLIISDTLAA